MSKYCSLILFVILTYTQTCFSQEKPDTVQLKRNSVYIELVGNTGLLSVNYDRILYHKNNFKLAGSVGFSIFPSNTCPVLFPIEINGLYGKTKHYFEYGIGFTPVIYLGPEGGDPAAIILLRFGYRYQKTNGGLFFKIGFTPVIQRADDKFGTLGFTPSAGLSFGWTFKNRKNQIE